MLLDKKELDENELDKNELDKSELRRKCTRRNVTGPRFRIFGLVFSPNGRIGRPIIKLKTVKAYSCYWVTL